MKKTLMYKRYWFIVLVLLAPGFTLAQAPENALVNEKFYFRVGGQAFTRFRTTVRVDSERMGDGTEITLEDATNLEEEIAVARFDGFYRFTDKHSMGFSYYDIDRTGSAILEEEITWDGEVFPVNITVESVFRQEVLEFSYAYSFLVRPKGVMAATVGLHTMRFSTGLREVGGDRERNNSTDAPLPSIGIRGQYRFGEKWRFVGKINWLDVSVGDYRGKLTDTLLTVEHDTWDRIGLGFGINSFGLKLESAAANLKGLFDIKFDSFVVFFKGHFGRD